MSAVSEPRASTGADSAPAAPPAAQPHASEPTAGQIGELYACHARRLEQIVRVDVRAPQPLIEDACQFAWSRLVFHEHRIKRETALPWLVTTAVREAFKLIRREVRDLSLDCVLEESAEPLARLGMPAPDEQVEHRERLADLRRLPERQQRLMWLQGLGLSYDEMAACEGCTVRTVERQLRRAKRAMRATSSA
jgi:RNA polymerase sigma factor (sigma-70 family)